MAEIAKGILGGAWSLLVGWILPVFIVLQVMNLLVTPSLDVTAIDEYGDNSAADQQLTLVFLAVVVGISLSAVQTPMYKILEGYWLWPSRLKLSSKERHARLRQAEIARAEADATRWGAIRYPMPPVEVLPTMLGNAIRRFETYAADRYQLDSIRLFHHLAASAPVYVQMAYERARTNVDFAVCLLWTSSAGSLCAIALLPWFPEAGILVFALLAAFAAVLAYRLAVVSTDEWGATMRAMVDTGRKGTAEAFGLTIPRDLRDEREMWSYVNLFARGPFAETGTASDWITHFRGDEQTSPDASIQQTLASIIALMPQLLDRSPAAGTPVNDEPTTSGADAPG